MGRWVDLIGTVNTVLKIGLNKASLDAGALTAPRTFALPDAAGTLALTASPAFTGNPTAPTALQFDNDTSIATTAYAMSIGMRSNGAGAYGATASLGAADFGRTAYFSHATVPGTLTLPATTTQPVGSLISICCVNAAPCTVSRAGVTIIYALGGLSGFGVTSLVLQYGDFLTLYWTGVNWIQVAGGRLTDEHAAIAARATTPNPGTVGRKVWSTTALKTLTWNGTLWEAPAAITASATDSIVLDFGAYPGSNEATATVAGQTTILDSHRASATVFGDGFVDTHTPSDHRYAAALMGLSCSTPIAGTGFTIYARSIHKLQGRFRVIWSWGPAVLASAN